MSTTAGVNERLAALTAAGTSVWLDQMRRSMVEGGEVARMVEEDSLRGVTSNPAIFEKAILGSEDYDEQLTELAQEGSDVSEMYRQLVVRDVRAAADVLRGVWEDSGHVDGYVSLEVEPDLAHDTEKTSAAAKMYWELVDRPNLMIKIPGTDEGLPAIEDAIAAGINVNVTLLFGVEPYSRVAEAFIRGLERRHEAGESLDVHSVASFFVSRVDTEIDRRLEKSGHTDLLGRAGLANARKAYRRFREIFHSERFAALAEAGAPVQRPLWASTGVKDPRYPDTLYVDGLVAPETVNTMPMETLLAAGEHAEIDGATADIDPSEDLRALADAGIDLDEVTDLLLREGIEKFIVPMEKLMAGIESQREAVVAGRPRTFESSLPDDLLAAVARRIAEATREDVARRVWKKDPTLWGGTADTPELAGRLGWLTIAGTMHEQLSDLLAFADEVKAAGLTDVVLLGMGGSSLAPEVFRQSFQGTQGDSPGSTGGLRLHVLDSTDAGAVLAVENAVDLEKTLFVVSSKSGGTVEPNSMFRHFWSKTPNGDQFIAITDPGTSLEKLAGEHGFRRVFHGDAEIGGRYSALSAFGIVPAALMGAPVGKLLDGAQVAEQGCRHYDSSQGNSGLWLGVTLGELARHGRNKLTFIVTEEIASFGLWAEQLVAESTGKEGKGILPVAGEPVGDPSVYGDDRVFIALGVDDDSVEALAQAGHPVLTIPTEGPEDLGRIMFFSEFATAVAGWALGINPFDQPNVQEAKDNTNKVLSEGAEEPAAGDPAFVMEAAPPQYVAIMGYVKPSDDFDAAIDDLRVAIRDTTKATTTYGYGPRFLHSTGQFHKGGPAEGLFLQIVCDDEPDVEIPDAPYTFNELKNAQATGDLQTLRAHGLRAERVRLEGDPAAAVRELVDRLASGT